MGRYGRRISRSLIGALVVTVAIGLIFYLKNLASTRAAEQPQPTKPAPQAVNAPPRVTQRPRPATAPAAQPQLFTTITPPTPTQTPTPTTTTAVTVGGPAPAQRAVTNSGAAAPIGSLSDGIARKEAGDLLGARRMLNAALLSGRLSGGETDSARRALADISQTVVFSPKRFPDDEFGGTHSVQSGEVLKKIAEKYDVTWELLMRLNGMTDPERRLRAAQTLKILHGPFNLVVNKHSFTLDVYLGPPAQGGGMYVTSFAVGLGKDDSTPTGTWLVEAGKKIKNPVYYSPRGEGVIDADDPKNPLGERWIGLTGIDGHAVGKASYGIHGTIDESTIGRQESMGCIRLRNADAEIVFDLVVDGKSVVVVKE